MSNKTTKNLDLIDLSLNQQQANMQEQLENNQFGKLFSEQLEKFQSFEETFQLVICEAISTLLRSLLALTNLIDLGVLEFGYRQFLSNGTTIGFCTRNASKTNLASSTSNTKAKASTKEREREKHSCYETLKQLYNQESNNSLAVFKRTKSKIEGFYFIASSSSQEIIKLYINHFEYFERFINLVSFYVDKILEAIKSAGSFCEKLYAKVFSQNALKALFPELITKKTKTTHKEI